MINLTHVSNVLVWVLEFTSKSFCTFPPPHTYLRYSLSHPQGYYCQTSFCFPSCLQESKFLWPNQTKPAHIQGDFLTSCLGYIILMYKFSQNRWLVSSQKVFAAFLHYLKCLFFPPDVNCIVQIFNLHQHCAFEEDSQWQSSWNFQKWKYALQHCNMVF